MLMAGESSGALDTVLLRMANHYERENKLKNKIKGAMIYPIVLMSLTVVADSDADGGSAPVYRDHRSRWRHDPLPTRILIGLSSFMQSYWYLVAGIVIWQASAGTRSSAAIQATSGGTAVNSSFRS